MISKAEFLYHRGSVRNYRHAIERVKWRWFVHTQVFGGRMTKEGYLYSLIEALLVLQYMVHNKLGRP